MVVKKSVRKPSKYNAQLLRPRLGSGRWLMQNTVERRRKALAKKKLADISYESESDLHSLMVADTVETIQRFTGDPKTKRPQGNAVLRGSLPTLVQGRMKSDTALSNRHKAGLETSQREDDVAKRRRFAVSKIGKLIRRAARPIAITRRGKKISNASKRGNGIRQKK